ALRDVGIVGTATACGAFFAASEARRARSTDGIADIHGETVFAVDGERLAVSIENGRFGIDYGGCQQRADDFEIATWIHGNAGCESGFDGKLCRVLRGDAQAALLHEMAQVIDAAIAEAGTHIVSVIDATQVRGDVSFLPGKRIAPHGHALDDLRGARIADRREENDIVF